MKERIDLYWLNNKNGTINHVVTDTDSSVHQFTKDLIGMRGLTLKEQMFQYDHNIQEWAQVTELHQSGATWKIVEESIVPNEYLMHRFLAGE